MKKLLVLSIAALLVLAGCGTVSPEDAFEKVKENSEESEQTINFVVASILTTEDGDLAFDNMGTISKAASEDFVGIVDAKVELEGSYVDVTIYAPEDAFVIELDGSQSKVSLEEVLNSLGIINFTELNELVDGYDDVTTEGSVHTYTLESNDIDDVLEFANHGHLNGLTFKAGSMKQTLTVEKNVLTTNEIYIESVYSDDKGVDYPVTQNITLKYTPGSTVEFPEFN